MKTDTKIIKIYVEMSWLRNTEFVAAAGGCKEIIILVSF